MKMGQKLFKLLIKKLKNYIKDVREIFECSRYDRIMYSNPWDTWNMYQSLSI